MIHLVVAMPSEAQPLRQHYGLREQSGEPFPLYAGPDMRLVISGIGIEASAAAVGYLAGCSDAPSLASWLNVGIAGHRDLAPGAARIADRVSRDDAPRRLYPELSFGPPVPTCAVASHAAPVERFPAATCCDMEAYGFLGAAQRISSVEFAQVLKIVSDNAATGFQHLTRQSVNALVGDALTVVDDCVAALREHAAHRVTALDRELLDTIVQRWHFTVTQQHQLRHNLDRLAALGAAGPGLLDKLAACRDARAVINAVSAQADQQSPQL